MQDHLNATASAAQQAPKQPSFNQLAAQFGQDLLTELRGQVSIIGKSTPPERSSNLTTAATQVTNHRVMQMNVLLSDGYERIGQWARHQNVHTHLLASARRDLEAAVSRLYETTTESWRQALRTVIARAEASERPVEDSHPQTVRPSPRVGYANLDAAAAKPARAQAPLTVQLPRALPKHTPVRLSTPQPQTKSAKKHCPYVDPIKGACGNFCMKGCEHCRHHSPEQIKVIEAKRAAAARPVPAAPRQAQQTATTPGKKRVWTAPSAAELCTYEDPLKGRCKAFRKKGCNHCAKHPPERVAAMAARRAAQPNAPAARKPRPAQGDAPLAVQARPITGPAGEVVLPSVKRMYARLGGAQTSTPRQGERDLPALALFAQPPEGEGFAQLAARFGTAVKSYFAKQAANICALQAEDFDALATSHQLANAVVTRLRDARQASLTLVYARCNMHIALWAAAHSGEEVGSVVFGLTTALADLHSRYEDSFEAALVRDEEMIDSIFADMAPEATGD